MHQFPPALVHGALERALKILGPEKVSAALNSPPELLQTWLNGFGTMPDRKVQVLIGLLADLPADK